MNYKFIQKNELSVYYANMTEQDLDRAFHAALDAILGARGYGAKAQLAKAIGVTPTYITRLAKSKAYGSELTRRRIAGALGFDYEEFLNIGRSKLKGEFVKSSIDYDTSTALGEGLELQVPDGVILRTLYEYLKNKAKVIPLSQEQRTNMNFLMLLAEQVLSSNHPVEREALKSNIISFASSLRNKLEHREMEEKLAERAKTDSERDKIWKAMVSRMEAMERALKRAGVNVENEKLNYLERQE